MRPDEFNVTTGPQRPPARGCDDVIEAADTLIDAAVAELGRPDVRDRFLAALHAELDGLFLEDGTTAAETVLASPGRPVLRALEDALNAYDGYAGQIFRAMEVAAGHAVATTAADTFGGPQGRGLVSRWVADIAEEPALRRQLARWLDLQGPRADDVADAAERALRGGASGGWATVLTRTAVRFLEDVTGGELPAPEPAADGLLGADFRYAPSDDPPARDTGRALEVYERDFDLSMAAGRLSHGQVDGVYVPGDVAAVRAFAARSLELRSRMANKQRVDGRSSAWRQRAQTLWRSYARLLVDIYDAAPFFVPLELDTMLQSVPADDDALHEIVWPHHRCLVVLGTNYQFGTDDLAAYRRPGFAGGLDAGGGGITPHPTGAPVHLRGTGDGPYEGGVLGCLLREGPFGMPEDDVVWLTWARVASSVGKSMFYDAVPARWRGTRTEPLVRNLVTALSWATWNAAPEGDVVGDERNVSRALKKSRGRKLEKRGAAVPGLRVLDLAASRRSASASTSQTGDGEGKKSPHAHVRRGHFRRARVGPRDDWHYETRWIAPTTVGDPLAIDPSKRVYTLPLP